jgi:G protein beta subunit-like protein
MCSWVTLMSVVVMKQVPEVDTAVRSLTVMWDGSLVVAANNNGTCYVWRLLRGTQVLLKLNFHVISRFYVAIERTVKLPDVCQ